MSLLWVDYLDVLPETVRNTREGFGVGEFMPVVRRIVSVSDKGAPAEWEVETDRGRTLFLVNGEAGLHRLAGNRALITDAHASAT